MAIILFDQPHIRKNLLPFTYTRPISEIRIGIFTISEKWSKYIPGEVSWLTEKYLESKFPFRPENHTIFISGNICPNPALVAAVQSLPDDTPLYKDDFLLAFKSGKKGVVKSMESFEFKEKVFFNERVTIVSHLWDIFRNNRQEITNDFGWIKANGTSEPLTDPHTRTYNPENIFLEPGVKVRAAILNAENGPIYLGKGSEVGDGAIVRGPFALGEGSSLKMGSKVIGDTSIGPFCKMGGEISNSVVFGYSNKSHDGFLGNSVVGEWCNIGADTNTSNLKNNYKQVKLWSYHSESMEETELQFCGLMMGDHAKCGINTMFNTATVAGVGANIFGAGFPPNFIPSFAWGGVDGFETFKFEKFMEMTKVVMERRSVEMLPADIEILEAVYNMSAKFRTWEK